MRQEERKRAKECGNRRERKRGTGAVRGQNNEKRDVESTNISTRKCIEETAYKVISGVLKKRDV